MCVIYVWDRNMSGIRSLRRSRAAKLTRVEKKKKSISVPVGCQSFDEQVILPSNFHRDSFDRYNSSFSSPLFLFIYLLNLIVIYSSVS